LFERKQGNPAAMLNLEDRKERLAKRYHNLDEGGKKIHEYIHVSPV